MPFLSFFHRDPAPEKYERALSETSRKKQLALRRKRELQLRGQRAVSRWTLGTSVLYSLFLAIFALNPRGTAGWVAGFFAPVAIYTVRLLLNSYFARAIANQGGSASIQLILERRIETLVRQQRESVEEMKRQTQFYATQSLVQRFEGEEVDSEREYKDYKDPEKWYDRILGLLIGQTERQALICRQCRTHNGLAPSEQPAESVTYRCPHCKCWNGPPLEVAEPVVD